MNFRSTHLAFLIIALALPALTQDLPRHEKPATRTQSNSAQPSPGNPNTNATVAPNQQDRDHTNDAITNSTELEKSESQMQKSAPALQATSAEAERKLASETSSDRVSWASTCDLIWSVLGFAIIVALGIFLWRSGRRYATLPDTHAAYNDDFRRVA